MEHLDPGPFDDLEKEMFQSQINESVQQKEGVFERDQLDRLLYQLGERLDLHLDRPVNPIVIGGSALNLLDIVHRPTHDVDIVGQAADHFEQPNFPEEFWAQAQELAREQSLESEWINQGPTMLGTNMPDGFLERTAEQSYGDVLTVHFADRYDQVHFKLYAGVDRKNYHLGDLMACEPSDEELVDAVEWIERSQAPSDTFRERLLRTLRKLGRDDAVEQIHKTVPVNQPNQSMDPDMEGGTNFGPDV